MLRNCLLDLLHITASVGVLPSSDVGRGQPSAEKPTSDGNLPVWTAGEVEMVEKERRYCLFLSLFRNSISFRQKRFSYLCMNGCIHSKYMGIIGITGIIGIIVIILANLSLNFFEHFFFLPMIKCEQSIYSRMIGKRKLSTLFWAYQQIFVRTFDKKDTFFAVFQWSEKKNG